MAVIGDSKLRQAILLGIALGMLAFGPIFDSNGAARGASPAPPVTPPSVQLPPIPSAPTPPVEVPDLPAPVKVAPVPPQVPPTSPPPNLPQPAAGGASPSPAESGGGAAPSIAGETSGGPSGPVAAGGASLPPPQPHSTIKPRSRPAAPVADSRIAPLRGWLIRLWPAVALGPTALATVFDALESDASSLAADIAASFREGVAGVGAASPSAAKNPQATSSDSPSPPRAWLPSDPSLPIAIFWAVMAAAAAFLTLMVRRELGLPAHKRRWRF